VVREEEGIGVEMDVRAEAAPGPHSAGSADEGSQPDSHTSSLAEPWTEVAQGSVRQP
jgi:hypothetical protein